MQCCALHEFFDIVCDRYGVPVAPQAEDQSGDYESGTVTIGAEHWRIRTARVTPRKPGAFVAVWKRDEAGETKPFVSDEAVDGLLVFVREALNFEVSRYAAS